jgi:hypothetical protein
MSEFGAEAQKSLVSLPSSIRVAVVGAMALLVLGIAAVPAVFSPYGRFAGAR